MTHSINMTAYFGDLETFHSTHLIGPYPTAADRNRDLRRLAALPGNNGDATFNASSDDPTSADHSCTPEQVAAVKHFNQVVGALYGYEVDDNGDDAVTREQHTREPAPRQRRELDGQGALFDMAGRANG